MGRAAIAGTVPTPLQRGKCRSEAQAMGVRCAAAGCCRISTLRSCTVVQYPIPANGPEKQDLDPFPSTGQIVPYFEKKCRNGRPGRCGAAGNALYWLAFRDSGGPERLADCNTKSRTKGYYSLCFCTAFRDPFPAIGPEKQGVGGFSRSGRSVPRFAGSLPERPFRSNSGRSDSDRGASVGREEIGGRDRMEKTPARRISGVDRNQYRRQKSVCQEKKRSNG